MTNDHLDRLEQIAKAATPGPWKATGLQYGCFYILTDDESGMVADDAPDAGVALARARGYGQGLPMEANAAHIAAFHPETAQQLITAIRTEREARAGLERAHQCAWDAVRDGVELDAYRVGKWDLAHAIEHRVHELAQQVESHKDREVVLNTSIANLHDVIRERDQQVEALRQARDYEFERAERNVAWVREAQQDAARLREALRMLQIAVLDATDDAENCEECGIVADSTDTDETACAIHRSQPIWQALLAAWEVLGPCVCGHPRSQHREEDSAACLMCACEWFKLPDAQDAALTAPADPTGGQ